MRETNAAVTSNQNARRCRAKPPIVPSAGVADTLQKLLQYGFKSLLALCTLAALFCSSANAADAPQSLIVRYSHGKTFPPVAIASQQSRKRSIRRWNQLTVVRNLDANTELVTSGEALSGEQMQALVETLNETPGVAFASPNYRRQTMVIPNDPLYSDSVPDQRYLYDGQFSAQAQAAWDISTGSGDTVIAIVDTGYLPNHLEISGKAAPGTGYDFVSPDRPGVFDSANDGNGRDSDPTDAGDACDGRNSSWHGTAVASVAAGNSNDGVGLAAIDWNARLLHVRALGACGGTDADIIDAVRWAAGLPVDGVPQNPSPASIINLSLGGITECTRAWQAAIDELNAIGATVVQAAGNERNNALRSSPGNCADIITVASNTLTGVLDQSFSNYGLKVTISTAGREIVTANNRGRTTAQPDDQSYAQQTGSSFSVPIVVGALGLMDSLLTGATPADITSIRRSILQRSATAFDNHDNCGGYCGGGILNTASALQMSSNFDGTLRDAEREHLLASQSSLDVGETRSTALNGYRAIHYFRIEINAESGYRFASEGQTDLYAYLLDDRLSTLAINDDSGSNRNFRIDTALRPGTYWLAVERAENTIGDGRSDYSVSVTRLRGGSAGCSLHSVPHGSAPVIDPLPLLMLATSILWLLRRTACHRTSRRRGIL